MKRRSSGTAFAACREKFDSLAEHTVPMVRAVNARIEKLAERVRGSSEAQPNIGDDISFADTPLALPASLEPEEDAAESES